MSKPAAGAFVHRRRVMWGEADAACAVDLSTVTRYCMEALESWFRERLGADWYCLSVQRRIATPFVRAEIEFKQPVPAGEDIVVTVTVEKLGRSSVGFCVVGALSKGVLSCWEGHFTCVFSNPDTRQSLPIPDEYRLVIERELGAEAGPGA